MKVEANAPGDDRVSLLCMRVDTRLLCPRKRLVSQELTKVAQYFSAGLTFRNVNVPSGTIDHCYAPVVTRGKKKRPFLSSLTGRTYFLRYFPASRAIESASLSTRQRRYRTNRHET
jgi:hypothetical protein